MNYKKNYMTPLMFTKESVLSVLVPEGVCFVSHVTPCFFLGFVLCDMIGWSQMAKRNISFYIVLKKYSIDVPYG